MIPILNEELFIGLAHAAQHPDPTFTPKYLREPQPQPISHVSTKNLRRVHKLRRNKVKPLHEKTRINPLEQKKSVITSIAQEITLARDVAKEMYEDKELNDVEWQATKELLKKLSAELLKKRERLFN